MKTIVFIGFRGSGKTTLGKWLAEILEMPCFDSDDEVLSYLVQDSITAAWETLGEQEWRRGERVVIPRLLKTHAVVSLGGGAPMDSTIATKLSSLSIVFNLTADSSATIERIEGGSDRPALSSSDLEIRAQRLDTYAALGTCEIDTSRDIASTQAEILAYLASSHQILPRKT